MAKDVVLKMAWQQPSSHSEMLLRLATYHGVKGVVHLYESSVVCRLSEYLRGILVPDTIYVSGS